MQKKLGTQAVLTPTDSWKYYQEQDKYVRLSYNTVIIGT